MPQKSHALKIKKNGLIRAIGLMSGTSMDGIDVALLESDGKRMMPPVGFLSVPYSAAFRKRLRAVLGQKKAPEIAKELTLLHAAAVKKFLQKYKLKPKNIDVIGFHGHTIFHEPAAGITVQIGDGKKLASLTGIPVIYDFRSDDVRAGGQGAPLVPVYHQAIAMHLKKPVVFLNIGGVANITYLDEKNAALPLLAFDTGTGNALLDDWILQHTKKPYDDKGRFAAKGKANAALIKKFLAHDFFAKLPPKSIDRDLFKDFIPHHLDAHDGAATLTMMTVAGVKAALKHLPEKPQMLIVCGGGRKNNFMMKALREITKIPVKPIEKINFNGELIKF